MSILNRIRTAIFKPATHMVNGRLEPEQVPPQLRLEPKAIPPNKAYVSILLRSLIIENVKIAWNKLYGVVHSFIKLSIYQTEKAEFNCVTVPDMLKNIDSSNLHLVIQRDIPLLNKVPFRGGRIKAQMGLFAVKSDNLMDKFLGLLGELSDAAGVDYVKQALPFVGPITKGINLILGVPGQSTMLAGLNQGLDAIQGHYVVTNMKINDPRKNSLSDLSLDKNYRLRKKNGRLLDNCSYFVFTIKEDDERHTWYDAPDLGTAYANLRLAIKCGNEKSIKEAYKILHKAILSSPDLILKDAKAIAKAIYEQEVEPWLESEKLPVPSRPPRITATTLRDLPVVPPKPKARLETVKPEMIAALGLTRKLSKKDRESAKNITL